MGLGVLAVLAVGDRAREGTGSAVEGLVHPRDEDRLITAGETEILAVGQSTGAPAAPGTVSRRHPRARAEWDADPTVMTAAHSRRTGARHHARPCLGRARRGTPRQRPDGAERQDARAGIGGDTAPL